MAGRTARGGRATAGGGRAARRRALVRAEILAAAADLFRARGYRATTLDDLARRLGMSKATLYGHFRSKEDLLAAIFHRTMTLVESGLAEIRRSGAPPAEQLRRVLRHQVRTVVAHQAFLTVFFAEETSLPPRLGRAVARRKVRYDRSVQAIVEAGMRSGAFGPSRPRLLVWALLGMTNWVYRWFDPRGAWDADDVADAFIALVERGYLARGTRRRSEAGRRLARIERELAALRPLLDGLGPPARRLTRP
jgi:AcrR family transcriptional regulator